MQTYGGTSSIIEFPGFGTFIIPASKPSKLELAIFLVLYAPLISLIVELKKLFAGRVGIVILVPLILNRSSVYALSPSKAAKANCALTGPIGIEVKPVIGISKDPEPLKMLLKPAKISIFFAVVNGSSYTKIKFQPPDVLSPKPD